MPRLNSFSSEMDSHEEFGNEWKVYYTPGFLLPKVDARKGIRSVPIGFQVQEFRQITKSISDLMHGLHQYSVRMPLNGEITEFSIVIDRTNTFKFEPDIGSMHVIKSRTEIVLKGIGRAVYRNAWKDSDTEKSIIAFVDVTCENPANEEDLVWLAGYLGWHTVVVLGSNPFY